MTTVSETRAASPSLLPPSRPSDRALTWAVIPICTDSDLAALSMTLDSVRASTRAPDAIVVLDATLAHGASALAQTWSAAGSAGRRVLVYEVPPKKRSSRPRSPREALRHWLISTEAAADDDLLWVLLPGSLPEPEALEYLLEAYHRSPSVGMVGAKHRDVAAADRLHSVGISATRSGRVIASPHLGEADQGQYDQRTDVLAVPLAGGVIATDLLRGLSRRDTPFDNVAADLDLGWRVQRAGSRVVVVPRARMRSGPGYGVGIDASARGRRQARRVALARASWWGAPLLAVWIALSSLGAAVGLLLAKRPRQAQRELADVGALLPPRTLDDRWRTRGPRSSRRRDLKTLFVPGSLVAREVGDRMYAAIFAAGPRRVENTPDAVPRSFVGAVLGHPGVLAVVSAIAVTAAAGRGMGWSSVTRLGSGLAGGELLASDATASNLWAAATESWRGSGLGDASPATLAMAVLAIPTWVLERFPGGGPAHPAGAVTAALVLGGIPIATASAYFSARVISRSRPLRAGAAVAWGCAGALPAAVASGRVSAIAAAVILPPVLAGVVMLARPQGSATGACATALGGWILGMFAPVLLMLVLAICVVLIAAAPPAVKWRAAVPLLGAPALLGPWLADLAADPSLIVSGLGLAQWGETTSLPTGAVALLHTGDPGSTPWWVGAVVVACAAVGLLLRNPRVGDGALGPVLLGAGVLVVVGVAGSVFMPRVQLGESEAGPVSVWAGTYVLVTLIGLIAAALIGAGELAAQAKSRPGGRGKIIAGGALILGFAPAIVAAGALVWLGLGNRLQAWTDPRPAVAIDQARSGLANRTVLITTQASGPTYRVVGREVGAIARQSPSEPGGGDVGGMLASSIGQLLDGTGRSPATDLGNAGVGFIAIDQGADDTLVRRLDASDGLARLAPRAGYFHWRVTSVGGGAGEPAGPSRLRLSAGEQPIIVAAQGDHAQTQASVELPVPGELVVAESMGWARLARVEVNGREVEPRPNTTYPTYPLNAGSAVISIDVDSGPTWWRTLQIMLIAVVAFLAVPFGRREPRKRRL